METSRIPHDETKIFTDIFESDTVFLESWKECGLYEEGLVNDNNIKKLFFLLYERFGNSAIAYYDVTQFQYAVYSRIYQFAPNWQKEIEIQQKLRNLSDEELMKGSKAIINHAYNPSTGPSTCGLEEIQTINDQNTTNYKKSKMEGFGMLVELLNSDVTREFVDRFRDLFATFVYTSPDLFITEGEN